MSQIFDSNTPLSPFLENTQIGISHFDDFSVLQITGTEAKDFLQNMTSHDVNQLVAGRNFQLSTFNSGKGRVEASFFLHRKQDDGFLMILHASLAAMMVKKLTMFKLRSDVQIRLVENQFLLALTGEGASEMTAQLTALPTPAPLGVSANSDVSVLTLPTQTPCVFIFTDFAGAQQIVEDARTLHAMPAHNNRVWQTLIESNLPFVGETTTGSFVLQQINYDLIDGVSFKKGCYPGQEVVARMQYLGKPSRRTYLMQCGYDAEVSLGQRVFNTEDDAVGEIVNLAQLNHDDMAMLVCLKVKALEGTFKLKNGEVVTMVKQPYLVDLK
jgi:folate-binding protein YgfZ